MSAMMVFMVTLIVTAINLGFPHDFLWQWAKACVIAWPVAGTTAFFAMPVARRVTGTVVGALKGNPDSRKN